MRRGKTFVRKTRKGKVLTIVKEHYLRDDIYCCSPLCGTCPAQELMLGASPAGGQPVYRGAEGSAARAAPAPVVQYVVPDTNVLLHQMDLVERMTNVVFLQTALDEARHRNRRVHARARKVAADPAVPTCVFSNEHNRSTYCARRPGESPNDHNDRAIRAAAAWYAAHLAEAGVSVLLLTDDAENRRLALAQGLEAASVAEFVRGRPELEELLAARGAEAAAEAAAGATFEPYEEHLTEARCKQLLEEGRLARGTFRVSRDYWAEGSVTVRSGAAGVAEGTPVLLATTRDMNRAIDGDVVAVELYPRSQWRGASSRLPEPEEARDEAARDAARDTASARVRPTGRVVAVLQRNWRLLAGSLEVTDRRQGAVLFLPVDRRMPKVRVRSRRVAELQDQRICVQIDSWPRSSRYPLGHFVRSLGTIGDRDVETKVLLMEHDVDTSPWSKRVLDCLPPDGWQIPDEEVARRWDVRETRRVVSIDPPGCKDIDDALHVHRLPNGNLEVAVHIADVTHFVAPDCALDLEARKRGTSVYLVERRIDMIPTRLSTDLCSLVGGVDRLAFSCIWEMTPEAEIVDTRFRKCVIRSAAALSYGDAQAMLDAGDETGVAGDVKQLNALARVLRRRRIEAGALTLASPQVKFLLDSESQKPTDVEMYKLKEANALVEEFMLLANVSVAKQILEHFPTHAMLRRHPSPQPDRFEELVRAGSVLGFDVAVDSSRRLADSLDRCVVPGYAYFNTLIRVLATRCMAQAVYFSSGSVDTNEFHHYGLASPVYTHFTSPIRRYADVVVHRLLAASLRIAPMPDCVHSNTAVSEIADGINHRNRMAQMAGRASVELYTHVFFREKRVEEEACVVSVRSNGIRVLVPRYGIEGTIRLVDEAGEDGELDDARAEELRRRCTYDEDRMELVTPQGSFRIFDRLRVVIYVHENAARRSQLRIDLAENQDAKRRLEQRDELHRLAAKGAALARTAAAKAGDAPAAAAGKKRRVEEEEEDEDEEEDEAEAEAKEAAAAAAAAAASKGSKKKKKRRRK